MSVIPKAGKRPLEPADLGLKTAYTGLPQPVIVDGQIEEPGLRALNKDRAWLLSLLEAYGINEKALKKVSLASVDGTGHLHCTPGTGVVYRVEVPNGGWRAPTVSR
ncbi:MAG: DUF421 domain-containing protein, partial [Firmicutes bacterium]|nr:DUF421 domain-containing protein [Bacillota bacterium]